LPIGSTNCALYLGRWQMILMGLDFWNVLLGREIPKLFEHTLAPTMPLWDPYCLEMGREVYLSTASQSKDSLNYDQKALRLDFIRGKKISLFWTNNNAETQVAKDFLKKRGDTACNLGGFPWKSSYERKNGKKGIRLRRRVFDPIFQSFLCPRGYGQGNSNLYDFRKKDRLLTRIGDEK